MIIQLQYCNAFRSKPYSTPIEKDGNGELYDNTIMNVTDKEK